MSDSNNHQPCDCRMSRSSKSALLGALGGMGGTATGANFIKALAAVCREAIYPDLTEGESETLYAEFMHHLRVPHGVAGVTSKQVQIDPHQVGWAISLTTSDPRAAAGKCRKVRNGTKKRRRKLVREDKKPQRRVSAPR